RGVREPDQGGGGTIKDRPQCVSVRYGQRHRATYQGHARGGQATAHQHPVPSLAHTTHLRRSPLTLLEIFDGLLDDLPIDSPDLVRITDEQTMVAQRIDEARDSTRVLGDPSDRRIGEEPEVARPGDPEPGADIVAGLLWGQ